MTRLEQIRFQTLVRHFVQVFFDNELIAAGGEIHHAFVTGVSILGGLGLTYGTMIVMKYAMAVPRMTAEARQWTVISDHFFVVLGTMTLMGFLAVLSWDGLFPSRRDGHILGALPVRAGLIFRARLMATLMLFSFMLIALVLVPFLTIPTFQGADGFGMMLRRYAALAISTTAAAIFVYFGAAAAQAVLLAILPYAQFQRISGYLQLGVLLVSFSLFFLTPGVVFALHAKLDWVQWLPPYWFLGMWEELGGFPALLPGTLAVRGWMALGTVLVVAIAGFSVAYRSVLRKVVEGLPLAPSGPGAIVRSFQTLLSFTFLRNARERAVFWFLGRTIARVPAHRLLLAIYVGIGFAWVLSDVSTLLRHGITRKVLQPDPVTCSIPLSFAFFTLIGFRVLFTLPVELKANWTFRTMLPADGRLGSPVRSAVRKFLILAGIAPMAVIPFPIYALGWGWSAALLHTALYGIETWLILEILMRRFRKVPFACSWLPGQANLKVKGGVYMILFGSSASLLSTLEAHVLQGKDLGALWFFGGVMVAGLIYLRWSAHQADREQWSFTFEERPIAAVESLGLIR